LDQQLSRFHHSALQVLSKASEDNLKAKLFPVAAMKNVGTSTMVELLDINLTHNSNYFVYVVGTDGAGLCDMTSHQFKVDITAPVEGQVKIGPYWNLVSIQYTPLDLIDSL
jgi:ABC-type polysaccharide/polyol phosphate transport system ATPase subunit